MYKQIENNRRRSWVLIILFIGLLSAAGYAYGQITNIGYSGLVFALVISVGMTVISWFFGDKIVLATTGAKEIENRAENTYIWNLVENLCISTGMPRPRIYLINDSSPNAFATGRDQTNASIALTTGIIERLENEELEGVIAHELSHIKNQDIKIMMLVAVLVGALTILGDFFMHGSLFGGKRDRDRGGGLGAAGLAIGVALLILSPLIGQMIKFAISRRREFLADASAALITRYPEGLARALEKIRDANIPVTRASQATAHLWIASPSPSSIDAKISTLFSTHPPINERINELRRMGGAR